MLFRRKEYTWRETEWKEGRERRSELVSFLTTRMQESTVATVPESKVRGRNDFNIKTFLCPYILARLAYSSFIRVILFSALCILPRAGDT